MKYVTIFLLVSLISIVGIAAASAAIMYTLNIPSTVTVSGPSPSASFELKAYTDQACTQEVTSLNFGAVAPGGYSNDVVVYVKNRSTVSVTLSVTGTGSSLLAFGGYVNLNNTSSSPPPLDTLAPGDIAEVTLCVWAQDEATVGDKSLDVQIKAVA
jgi:FlaG/FlaF family flagellin (archaellin)